MVQMFNVGPEARDVAWSNLGHALGQGLGNFTGNYYATKKLKSILSDASLKGKSPAEKLEALVTGLAPYGKYGEKRLADALQIEQLKREEEQAIEDKRQIKDIQTKLGDSGISLEDKAALISQLPKQAQEVYIPFIKEMAKRQTQLQAQNQRASLLGLAPQEEMEPISSPSLNIQRGQGGAEAIQGEELASEIEQNIPQPIQRQPQEVPKSGFRPPYSQKQIQNALLMGDQQLAKNMISENKSAQTAYHQSPEFKRDEELNADQARQDSKFYTDLQERRGKQILKKDSLFRLRNMNKKGVSGKIYESFLDKMGLTAKTSAGRRELSAEVKNQFTDFKQIAGSQLSAAEFFVLAGAYPSADFSQEANEAIIDNLELLHETMDKEYEIATRLKKENGGKLPINYQEKVNAELQDFVSSRMDRIKDNIRITQNAQYGIPKGFTLMFDSKGEPLSVPESDVQRLLEDGLAELP